MDACHPAAWVPDVVLPASKRHPWPLCAFRSPAPLHTPAACCLPHSTCRKKADEYLAHFVGHEGSGSLLSALKARGWASELSAGVSDQSSVAWLFEVSITLTEAGLAAGPGELLHCTS